MKVKNLFVWELFILLFLSSCMDSEFASLEMQKKTSDGFTLEEAKSYFEEEVEKMSVSRSRASGKHRFNWALSPGEYNAQWEKAQQISEGGMLYYDLPIDANVRYKAAIGKKDKKGEDIKVRVYQRLMVIKEVASSRKAYYIVTLIPDAGSTGEVRCENFMRIKNHNNYSGLVLYLDPNTHAPIRISRYVNGEKTGGVFMAGDLEDAVEKAVYAKSLMNGISIYRISRNTASRSNDEEEWDWTLSDLVEEEDGIWLYWHYGHSHRVIDTDGDGIPDSLLMDDVVVTPDNGNGDGEEEEDSYYPPIDPETDPDPEPDYPPTDEEGTDEEDEEDESYGGGSIPYDADYQLGISAINKMKSDLESGNVAMKQVKMSQGEAILTGFSLGVSTNDIIFECLNFLKEESDDITAAKAFGTKVGAVGLSLGLVQTGIILLEGDGYTAGEILSIISTACSAVGIICVGLSVPGAIAGTIGIAGCVIGLLSNFFTYQLAPTIIEVEMENGSTIHIYISSPSNYIA